MLMVRAIGKNDVVLAGPAVTRSDGTFELYPKDPGGAAAVLASKEFRFSVRQRSFSRQISARDAATTSSDNFLVVMKDRPIEGTAEVIQQPLRSADSVGTFDVLLINSSTTPLLIDGGDIDLSTASEDCPSPRDIQGAEEVATSLQHNPDAHEVRTVSAVPVFGTLNRATFANHALCARINFTQPISVMGGAMKRVRIDVTSHEKRCLFWNYSRGFGPYQDYTAETGTQLVSTPRLSQPDLRYYQVLIHLSLSGQAAGLATGYLEAAAEIRPGEFAPDAKTLSGLDTACAH
jgi:hypothetical protein